VKTDKIIEWSLEVMERKDNEIRRLKRRVLALQKKKREINRRSEPPPSLVSKEELKQAGDSLDQMAMKMQSFGQSSDRTYPFNQLAHWLWRLAGAEPKL